MNEIQLLRFGFIHSHLLSRRQIVKGEGGNEETVQEVPWNLSGQHFISRDVLKEIIGASLLSMEQ